MAAAASIPSVEEPFPIFKLAHRFLLYDANIVSYIRQQYNICGVLIGGLPQAPQQNVFLGLPAELMPEEARLLVEKGVAYIADDVAAHKGAFLNRGLNAEERKAYQAALRKQGLGAARDATRKGDERKKAALKNKLGAENWNDIPDDMLKPIVGKKEETPAQTNAEANDTSIEGDGEALFAPPTNSSSSRPNKSRGSSAAPTAEPEPYAITPTTSYPPLQASPRPPEHPADLPGTPQSYTLFKHMHEQGYFLAPGLRFGCQYMAYPGDPLRFHSHFLCSGMDWDQEFDLLDLVGGGRLGTGVKKGFLMGGEEEERAGVRVFCIEWGGM